MYVCKLEYKTAELTALTERAMATSAWVVELSRKLTVMEHGSNQSRGQVNAGKVVATKVPRT